MTLKEVVKKIQDIGKALDIPCRELTLLDLSSNELSERQIRLHGGLSKIRNAYFPETEKNLKSIREATLSGSYVKKLEKELGDKQLFQDTITDSIKKLIKPIPKIQLKNIKKQKTKQKRELVMVLNDTHYGLIVDKEEINGLNSFDWKEACRRTAMVLQETIDFKPHTRGEVEKVHLILNGDIIAGLIHGLNTNGIDLYVHQLNGALHILSHVVSHLLSNFKYVEVTGISGNHCDAVHKREHGNRVISEKYDSYTNTVFYALSTAFKSNPRATFNFPKTPYGFFNLPGGRALIAHGDVLFTRSLGNPGTTINVKSLSDEIRKFNAGETAQGRDPVKLVIFGHTHSFAHFVTSDGVEIYNAPSLSGTDGFAHSLNINTNFIGQVVFESTKEFILGDHRLIRVNKADNNKELDKLIPTFERELSCKK